MLRSSLLALAALTLLVPAAFATNVYTDTGAGQTIQTAGVVNTMPGGTTLDEIVGTLTEGYAAIFEIYLTGGQTFSATTTYLTNPANPTFFDTELFLFDSNGIGVYANDDDDNAPPQSTLPASDTLTPTVSGIYYLAIAGTGYLPISALGEIFPSSGGFLDPTDGVVGPTGVGGSSALTGWTSTSSEYGDYEIDLTGAQFVSQAVPEPATGVMIGGGLLLAAALRRRFTR